jgi:hypothetical protein
MFCYFKSASHHSLVLHEPGRVLLLLEETGKYFNYFTLIYTSASFTKFSIGHIKGTDRLSLSNAVNLAHSDSVTGIGAV